MTDPNVIRDEIERTRLNLGEDVDALADKVSPSKIAQRQTDKVKNVFSGVKDRVMGSAEDAKDAGRSAASNVGDAVSNVGEAVSEAPRRAAQAAQGNPLAVGLIAFGVGWLASSFLPASDQEKKAATKVKEAAAPAVDQLKDVAKDAAEHLREPAQDAVQSVKETATDAVSNVKNEGADAAGGLKDQAADAKHAVQEGSTS
jgi:gas vesicle protein